MGLGALPGPGSLWRAFVKNVEDRVETQNYRMSHLSLRYSGTGAMRLPLKTKLVNSTTGLPEYRDTLAIGARAVGLVQMGEPAKRKVHSN